MQSHSKGLVHSCSFSTYWPSRGRDGDLLELLPVLEMLSHMKEDRKTRSFQVKTFQAGAAQAQAPRYGKSS